MMYKTHLTVSTTVALPILSAMNELSVFTIGGIILGSLLPDIDTPNSFIGSKVKPIAYLLNKSFQHRGLIHSLMPVVILIALGIVFASPFTFCVGIGFLLHLIEDGFSVSGIRWLQPFRKKNYKLPFDWMKYKTSSIKEHIILGIAIVILILELIHYKGFTSSAMSFINSHKRHYDTYSNYNSNNQNNLNNII